MSVKLSIFACVAQDSTTPLTEGEKWFFPVNAELTVYPEKSYGHLHCSSFCSGSVRVSPVLSYLTALSLSASAGTG